MRRSAKRTGFIPLVFAAACLGSPQELDLLDPGEHRTLILATEYTVEGRPKLNVQAVRLNKGIPMVIPPGVEDVRFTAFLYSEDLGVTEGLIERTEEGGFRTDDADEIQTRTLHEGWGSTLEPPETLKDFRFGPTRTACLDYQSVSIQFNAGVPPSPLVGLGDGTVVTSTAPGELLVIDPREGIDPTFERMAVQTSTWTAGWRDDSGTLWLAAVDGSLTRVTGISDKRPVASEVYAVGTTTVGTTVGLTGGRTADGIELFGITANAAVTWYPIGQTPRVVFDGATSIRGFVPTIAWIDSGEVVFTNRDNFIRRVENGTVAMETPSEIQEVEVRAIAAANGGIAAATKHFTISPIYFRSDTEWIRIASVRSVHSIHAIAVRGTNVVYAGSSGLFGVIPDAGTRQTPTPCEPATVSEATARRLVIIAEDQAILFAGHNESRDRVTLVWVRWFNPDG